MKQVYNSSVRIHPRILRRGGVRGKEVIRVNLEDEINPIIVSEVLESARLQELHSPLTSVPSVKNDKRLKEKQRSRSFIERNNRGNC